MKSYSPEFKADAVALYLSDPAHTYDGVGRDLGISRETLRNWVKIVRREQRNGVEAGAVVNGVRGPAAEPGSGEELRARLAAAQAEVRQLRKDNAKLATERDILRQATKFFAQEMTW